MTDDEAKAEAKRRWGDRGSCRDRGNFASALAPKYVVGTLYVAQDEGSALSTWGEGWTWEEAFAEAARRKGFMEWMENAPAGSPPPVGVS